jgi:hypothetical protein
MKRLFSIGTSLGVALAVSSPLGAAPTMTPARQPLGRLVRAPGGAA